MANSRTWPNSRGEPFAFDRLFVGLRLRESVVADRRAARLYAMSVASDSVLELADWDLRSKEFGNLREYDNGRPAVAMDYGPSDQELGGDVWSHLRDLWLDLSPHPHVVDALDRGNGGSLVLRYAAFDWSHPLLQLDIGVHTRERLAGWGVELTDAFLSILRQFSPADASCFRRNEASPPT